MSEKAPLRIFLNLGLSCTFIASVVLTSIGILWLCTDTTVIHVENYSDCHGTDLKKACMATLDSEHTTLCVCTWDFEVKQAIPGDVTLYYDTGFDHTRAAYASTRDEIQLRGEPAAARKASCDTFSSLKAEHEPEPYAVSYSGLLEGEATTAGVENEPCLKRKPVFRVVDPALRDGLPVGHYRIVIDIRSPLPETGQKQFVLVGVSARAQAGYVEAGAAALLAGVVLFGVLLLVIVLKRDYYVANLRAVLGRLSANIRTSCVVTGVAKAVLALYASVKNIPSSLQKVKKVLPCPLLAGLGLVLIGIVFLANVQTTVRTIFVEDYSNCHGTNVSLACVAKLTDDYPECNCVFRFEIKQDIIGDVSFYHYTVDHDQDDIQHAPAHDCGNSSHDGGRPISPCGELAFQDTFSNLRMENKSKPIIVSYTEPLVEGAYHNAPKVDLDKFEKLKSWQFPESHVTGDEAWSLKRKLVFRVVEPALRAGRYLVDVGIHCFSEHCRKTLVVEGASWRARGGLGALGAAALAAGLAALLYDVALLCKNNNGAGQGERSRGAGAAANGNPPEHEIQQTSHTAPAAEVIVDMSEE